MTAQEAAKILDLQVDATPEQIEARFLELRRKLEDKIAKAPTPGLQAKYRESLTQVTTAFETLVLAADSSSLPVLQRQSSEAGEQRPAKPISTGGGVPPPREASTKPAPTKKSSSGKEFLIVALLAIALLGAGGWWVMKTRAEAAAARVAAEAKVAAEKAEAEQKALAAKAEEARVARLTTELRTKLAEQRVAWEALDAELREAERQANEAKSELRNFRDGSAVKKAELSARVTGTELFTAWLRNFLLRHPAKVARARAEQFLDAKDLDNAQTAIAALDEAMGGIESEMSKWREGYLHGSGSVRLESTPSGMKFRLTDSQGHISTGTTPATVDKVPLTHVHDSATSNLVKLGEFTEGGISVAFSRPGWPDYKVALLLSEGDSTSAHATFPEGTLKVESLPTDGRFEASNAYGWKAAGATPATITVPVGEVTVRVTRSGYDAVTKSTTVVAGQPATLSLDQRTQEVRIKVSEAKSRIFVDSKFAGYEQATVAGLAPGEHTLQIEAQGYTPYRTKISVKQVNSAAAVSHAFSFRELSAQNIPCTACQQKGFREFNERCNRCNGSGWETCFQCEGRGRVGLGTDYNPYVTCPNCKGSGRERCEQCRSGVYYWTETCTTCGGDGLRSRLETQ